MAQIKREIKWDSKTGDAYLVLTKKTAPLETYSSVARPIKSFAIRQQDIWMFSEDHNPNFIMTMMNVCTFLCDLFDLGLVTSRKMAEIAEVIEYGIDDLAMAPPMAEKTVSIGEVEIKISDLRGEGSLKLLSDLIVAVPDTDQVH